MREPRSAVRLALAGAIAVAGCGGVEPPEGPQPAPAQWIRGRLRQLPPTFDDLRERRDPLADGWAAEAWAAHIEADLPARIRAELGESGRGLAEILAQDFAGSSAFWPAGLETAFDDGNLSVRRGRVEDVLHGREELGGLAGAWKSSLGGIQVQRVDVDVDALAGRGEGRFDTRIRVRVTGSAGAGNVQQNLRWAAKWQAPAEAGAGAPRLESLRVESCEEVRTRARPLIEMTRAILSRSDGFQEEILRGNEDYHLRQDRLGGPSFLGMHGLAVGDVDGDGLEDLYVPQPGGQPNRLLLHQADGTVRDGAPEQKLDLLDNCGPALILDLDGNGAQDVAVAAGPHVLVAWNDGSGKFSGQLVLEGPDPPEITGLAAADPDGDGDLDLYACRYVAGGVANGAPVPYWNADNGARNLYWRNEGGRKFVEAAAEVGLDAGTSRFSLALLWEDLDEDGDVDLLVVNDFGPNSVYRNDGGRFTDVAEAVGAGDAAAGMGASGADVDRDGDVDLFLTNMDSPAGSRVAANPLFMSGRETERPAYVHHARGNTLLLNHGDGTFRDATEEAGVAPGGWAWGGIFFDLQNDGWPDLHVPNGFATNADADDLRGFFWRRVVALSPAGSPATQPYLDAWDAMRHFMLFEGCSWNGRERDHTYVNLTGARFAEVSSALGTDFLDDSRLAAPMDWDDDGRLDLWLRSRTGPRLRFLRNTAAGGQWLALELVGTRSNRDAIGARASVEARGARSRQTVYSAQGFLCAPSRRLHFGLGEARSADRVEVRWPDGAVETFTDVPAGSRYRIVQGRNSIERVTPRPHPSFVGRTHEPVQVEPRPVSRTVLFDRLPARELPLSSFDGEDRSLGIFGGSPLLVWVGSCADPASLHTLRALCARRDELADLGGALVAQETGDPADEQRVRETFEDWDLDDFGGRASRRLLQALEVLLVEVLGPFDRLPQPLVLLFDRGGQLAVIYSGAIDHAVVLRDCEIVRALDPAEVTTEPILRGRWVQKPSRNLLGVAQIFEVLGDADLSRYYRGIASERSPTDAVR